MSCHETAHRQTSLNVHIRSVCVCVYIMVCMCTTSCCGEHFLSVGVDLWGPADKSTLKDENPLLEELLASLSIPLQVSRKRTLSRSALWRMGLAGTLQKEGTQDILPYPLHV